MSTSPYDAAGAREVELFVHGRPRPLRIFRIAYALLTLNFAIPVVVYLFDRRSAEAVVSTVNVALGGEPLVEQGSLWHMLAIGNVATLALLCAALWLDLRRMYRALPVLVFLKATSAVVSLGTAIVHGLPGFVAIFVLDGLTSLVMAYTARGAYRALVDEPVTRLPLWSYLLIFPRRIEQTLRLVASSGRVPRVPSLLQVLYGVLRMSWRVTTRPQTIGTSVDPIRPTRRARFFSYRVARFFVLLWERAIAPFDLSGLASSPDRIVRHVLGAHHDGVQLLYDLELLALHPGWLERLRDAAAAIVARRTARSLFLRDLCVFDGYHERVLVMTCDYLAGRAVASPHEMGDPDLSLYAHLAWCAEQPESLAALLFGGGTRSRHLPPRTVGKG